MRPRVNLVIKTRIFYLFKFCFCTFALLCWNYQPLHSSSFEDAPPSSLTGELGGLTTHKRSRVRLASVEVEITGVDSQYSKLTTTTASGMFKVEQVPIGKYKVTFRKKGFISAAVLTEVTNNMNRGIIINMEPTK